MKKYELTDETKTLFNGTVMHRIRALRNFKLAYGGEVSTGDLGGWVEKEDNLSQTGTAWIYGNAAVYGEARVHGVSQVYGYAKIGGDAYVKGPFDYAVFDNPWDGGQVLTYTRSNKMWRVDWFYGTGEELIVKAYKDGEMSGKCYEAIVRAQEAIDIAVRRGKAE